MRGLFLILVLFPLPLWADLTAQIDISDQKMTVILDGEPIHSWPVSTARKGKYTPRGVFTPKTMERMHHSSLYHNAPMPFSIFFTGNYAIHGTTDIARLGRPASAGCVRLHPDNAAILFNLVLQESRAKTRIVIRD